MDKITGNLFPDEVFNQPFPAMQRCMLIDARFSSRKHSEGKIKMTSLFEEVVIPPTIAAARSMLENASWDACILGPSVSDEAVEIFVDECLSVIVSTECAFIVLTQNEELREKLSKLNIHAFFPYNASAKQFHEGIIVGVVKANGNTPWRSLLEKYNPDLLEEVLSTDRNHESAEDSDLGSAVNIQSMLSLMDSEDTTVEIAAVPILRADDGSLNPDCLEMAQELATAIMPRMDTGTLEAGDRVKMHRFVLRSVLEWFVDLQRMPVADAKEKLSTKLRTYHRRASKGNMLSGF